jgi:acyl-CoA synthetase (AMP-forming)/AMP-acid ligase II
VRSFQTEITLALVIFRSPSPDVDIPEGALTPFVLQRATDLADKPAFIDGATGRTLTFGQFANGVKGIAARLSDQGFRQGDVFGIFAPNSPEWAVGYHAVASLGGVSTTINSLYTADDVAYQLKDSGAKFLMTVPAFLDRAKDAADRAGIVAVFVAGDPSDPLWSGSWWEGGSPPEVDIEPREDLVVLPYSSGTTGFPKGVMLTHYNIVANLKQFEAVHHLSEDDRVIAVLPFFHIYGQLVIMNNGLYKGATIVTMPKFELEPFLQLLQEHRITRAYLVPPVVLALAKHPVVDQYDLSSLRLVMSGAAPLDAGLAAQCEQRLGVHVIQGYGLTETSPVTHCTQDDDPAKNKPGSIGPPLPNTEVRVADWGTGENFGPNQDGEIWVRGPQVMKGYLNNPQATAQTIDENGWLHTGDIGRADADGYFTIVDRLKELIKYKGYQVPPAELEAVLLAHPAVADAAVIPKADEECGEIPKAFVVCTGVVDADALIAYVAERVAAHKKVREVEFVDEIPKSASGKILRRVLVERERGRTA